jgi:uncharacterized membrane protein
MPKGRLEAFSDGVIAVAITVLALDLPIPEPKGGASLAHELVVRWPSFAAFAVSFLTIGIVWINHHAMLARLAAASPYATLAITAATAVFYAVPSTTADVVAAPSAGS